MDIKNPIDVLTSVLKVPTVSIPANYSEIERYQLNPPFSDAVIAKGKSAGDIIYIVDERPLQSNEIEGYNKLRELVERDLEPPSEDKPRKNYHAQLLDIAESNTKILQGLPSLSVEKIIYYLERDILGFGKIDSLMADPSIEDISCAGVKKPIFIWHQNYDSLRTNLVFDTDQELEDFVMKQVHRAGKHTSAAFPVTDVTLPGKHRLAIYYKTEVTPFGTSFTIRKFREDPFTVIDLVETGTIDENIAAYFWLLMEHKFSTMIIGSTGAGKTTSLNAICCLIQPTNKICTIEEVSEINLPHENWVPLIARSGFGLENEGEISLFQLIKSALRHRPDFIVVGEVRGEESYVLFQALATGHGGLCTMHGDSASSAIKRLTQHPMNIAPGNIPLMHSAAVIKKVRMRKSDKESGNTALTALIVGEVIDLGIQEYKIKGKGGSYVGVGGFTDPKIEFELEATVIDETVTGEIEIKVKGNSDDGKTELKIEIPILGGDPIFPCFDLTLEIPLTEEYCDTSGTIPYLQLDNGDFIPLIFTGIGEATIKIGKEKTPLSVFIIVDTTWAQHPFEGGSPLPWDNTGQVNIIGLDLAESPLFDLWVDIKKFDVKYTDVITAGAIFLDEDEVPDGSMIQLAYADEDHVKDEQKDKGEITLEFWSETLMGTTSGKYKGKSEQIPDYGWLYLSTGKFNSKGDLKLKGEYETTWQLPLFFTSILTATIK